MARSQRLVQHEVEGELFWRPTAERRLERPPSHVSWYRMGQLREIVGMSQGFIVGESRCGGKAGLWCGRSLSFAVQRANPDRYMYRGDCSRWSMPVVLELQSLVLQKHRGSQKYVVPGDNFRNVDGILLRKVHLNNMWMMNYLMLGARIFVIGLPLTRSR